MRLRNCLQQAASRSAGGAVLQGSEIAPDEIAAKRTIYRRVGGSLAAVVAKYVTVQLRRRFAARHLCPNRKLFGNRVIFVVSMS